MIIDALFPKKCVECAKIGEYLCKSCEGKIKLSRQFCPNCAKPSIDGMTHPACVNKYSFTGCHFVFNYQGCIKALLLAMKYKYAYDARDCLVQLIQNNLKSEFIKSSKDTLLIPIPATKKREKWRGFNQAQIIGESLAENLNWNCDIDILVRSKNTHPQTGLKREDRLKNQKNS